ncbi:type II toxin-antitoxin system RatA family toxin [Halogeometricum limi]|uniref:Polyketide cyclase / dehydrase and lipid transport n=1 Tax=Halogeometricum limi TaxID=555875 RepID=A0A1I6GVC9_9EURY|nr:SRPBCC family protein [Halogeometricum limi]SFR46204.1 Polyketide cyclase / dehydrase and lipid transport [Halogeometricum limi]
MDEIVVSTVVYLPREEVYDFVVDFPRYANYSKHLRDVTRRGDGETGTRYEMRFSWWKLNYTTVSEVTELHPPERVEWRLVKDLRARGRWRIEELEDLPADAPEDAETASRVFFEVSYDADSADEDTLNLPRFVSLGWVIDKLKPALENEAERVVERIVEDLEGRRRPVELSVERRTG